jgi:D-sedoheptulose 7-phosphate isomerase
MGTEFKENCMDSRLAKLDVALEETIQIKRQLGAGLKEELLRVVDAIIESQQNRNQLLVMGNGGSAADAQHFVAELVGRFLTEHAPLNAHALTTNSSTLTCLINDYPPERLFARQVQAYAHPGDIVVGISTSGNSLNVINGLIEAKKIGAMTVGLTGNGGGKMTAHCDILLDVPSCFTPRIQEAHIFLIHMICEFVELAFTREESHAE